MTSRQELTLNLNLGASDTLSHQNIESQLSSASHVHPCFRMADPALIADTPTIAAIATDGRHVTMKPRSGLLSIC